MVAVSVVFSGAWSVATAADAASKGAIKAEPAGAPMPAVVEKSTAEAVVTITDTKLEPIRVTIKVDETVEWKNASKEDQTVTTDANLSKTKGSVEMPKGAKAFSSGDIKPGASFSHTFTVAGTYKYASLKQGKEGEVIVKAEEVRKAPAKAATTKTTKKSRTKTK
jgi:plastocyanin